MIASVFIAVMILVPVVILIAVGIVLHVATPWYARRAPRLIEKAQRDQRADLRRVLRGDRVIAPVLERVR